ncbi:16068_t:CDS:2 [Acaulospora morrowiae]|uniref:16068_t:CDS:1 n=1 Tax=Acaulospora morrowiae TaxID=94023 RepID=A0A9N9FT62_9GLOM|nr:16068_t:CDS:2 [Acaulospora morrowiae]
MTKRSRKMHPIENLLKLGLHFESVDSCILSPQKDSIQRWFEEKGVCVTLVTIRVDATVGSSSIHTGKGWRVPRR